MSARGDRRRVLSHEERVLWRTVTRSIAPLPDRLNGGTGEKVSDRSDLSLPEPVNERAAKRRLQTRAASIVPPPPPPPLEPLGRRMRQRVARGREVIEARFDLHGMTQSEAHAALLHFLRSASARGVRLVLVITGKGRRSGEAGVLRRQVPHWLVLPEFRSVVIGFEDAHITHGGEGALYVRLRRTGAR